MSLSRDTPRLIIEYLASICSASANFDDVNMAEPKSAPSGFDASVFMSGLQPAASGLTATSLRATFSIRVYQNMLMEPQGAIDALVASAIWDVMIAINADLTLGGLVGVRSVAVLGEDGEALRMETGYITIGGTLFRVFEIFVPVLLNDAMTQGVTA
jgi:hypothetical protein